ncbi:MAG: 2-oxoglutarate dehydrogenase E1 component [Caldilineaceae bacterium]|nr:2-oxoglutarate dehydrogenase E1 component [Caldilineaceae bacterium]
MASDLTQANLLSLFHGPNAGYVQELYERYQQDPQSVDASARALFAQWSPVTTPVNGTTAATTADSPAFDKIGGAVNLAQAIREYGHLAAQLDPLGSPPPGDPALDPATHGVSDEDLRGLPASLVGGPVVEQSANAHEAIQKLRAVYSGATGYDYDHLRLPEEREWLRHAAESRRFRPPTTPISETGILERLTQVEVFEHFLNRTYPGKTRFSIEGLDVMVPMLDEIVDAAVEQHIHWVLLGMAHRGRLNVLAHVLNKPYAQMLAEFKDPVSSHTFTTNDYLGYTGDVKYHAGANRGVPGDNAPDVQISMAPNPSHLEHVNPVVEGMARAAGTYVEERGAPRFDHIVSLPVLIHGDAAFPGQGVVAETLNLSRLDGYRTGGTIHIIANNQLGFTTDPHDVRSTLYASDLAKGFKIPIVHVNADDPVACIEAARLAAAYRHRFQKDFLIDLIGYRRYGHNEGDEPRFTQPVLYRIIEQHPTVRELWADHLVDRGSVDAALPQQLYDAEMDGLQSTYDRLVAEEALLEPDLAPPPSGAARNIATTVDADHLREINRALLATPEGFTIHPRLQRILSRRHNALDNADEANIDWSMAEGLALASILADGIAIRLTGEDVERGTFSHRHAVLNDAETGEQYLPLQSIPQARAAFEIHNSPLSEVATIGFEYGYNIQAPERLVIWEAQYGDFINVAQAMIDQFLVSGRAKWGQTPSLVLLLPHAYEGAGPDHSSGRLERFLQLAAETNMRIAYPTTAAQYFHLLRRQALLLKTDPLPLVVMTPKSLLRQRLTASSLTEFTKGRWQPVIDDAEADARADAVTRLILCSGKVYVDLVSSAQRSEHPEIAIVRVEQLYPFPAAEIEAILEQYPNVSETLWLQEEPENMGAWEFVLPRLLKLLAERCPLHYVGRPRRASPAEGSTTWHNVNQAALIEQAFTALMLDVGASAPRPDAEIS